jgi:HK97 family phage prohead protease
MSYDEDKKKKRRDLPEGYRPATEDDVPEGRACGNCVFFNESDVAPDGRARCTKWDEYVSGGFYCDAWEPASERGYDEHEQEPRMEITPVEPRAKGSKAEFRSFEGEIRTEGDGNTFVGYAAKFNVPSEPLPFTERIAPGAFAKSLRQRSKDVRLYINHNSDMVLASKRSGTLRLSEDATGLRVEADLPDTTSARDLRALMQAGVVSTMSFGFTVPRGGDKWNGDGSERTLTGINLHEVSVVTGFPAYPQTEAAVRSLEKLSERTGLAVDELTDALDALAEGEELDPAKADLLINAIKGAVPASEVEEKNDATLALKQKQIDLLAKKW